MDPDLPPAKRISQQTKQIIKKTFCLEQDKLVDKKESRSSKNKK